MDSMQGFRDRRIAEKITVRIRAEAEGVGRVRSCMSAGLMRMS